MVFGFTLFFAVIWLTVYVFSDIANSDNFSTAKHMESAIDSNVESDLKSVDEPAYQRLVNIKKGLVTNIRQGQTGLIEHTVFSEIGEFGYPITSGLSPTVVTLAENKDHQKYICLNPDFINNSACGQCGKDVICRIK